MNSCRNPVPSKKSYPTVCYFYPHVLLWILSPFGYMKWGFVSNTPFIIMAHEFCLLPSVHNELSNKIFSSRCFLWKKMFASSSGSPRFRHTGNSGDCNCILLSKSTFRKFLQHLCVAVRLLASSQTSFHLLFSTFGEMSNFRNVPLIPWFLICLMTVFTMQRYGFFGVFFFYSSRCIYILSHPISSVWK